MNNQGTRIVTGAGGVGAGKRLRVAFAQRRGVTHVSLVAHGNADSCLPPSSFPTRILHATNRFYPEPVGFALLDLCSRCPAVLADLRVGSRQQRRMWLHLELEPGLFRSAAFRFLPLWAI
jgi:hypothetical protein